MAYDTEWMKFAVCYNLPIEVFYPPTVRGHKPNYSHAKDVCRQCPVNVTCVQYAIAHNINSGVWGGMTPDERRALNKETDFIIQSRWFAAHPLADQLSNRLKEY